MHVINIMSYIIMQYFAGSNNGRWIYKMRWHFDLDDVTSFSREVVRENLSYGPVIN